MRLSDFRSLLLGRFTVTLGEQMLNVAIGWELYVRTHSALVLGFVGLALIVPILLFSLPAGQIIDRFNRKRILMTAQGLLALCAVGLVALSYTQGPVLGFYVCLFFVGLGDAFTAPASTALLAQVVPEATFANAATWNSSAWQLAAVAGPALGGALIAFLGHATVVYALYALFGLVNIALIARVSPRPTAPAPREAPMRALFAGVRFLGRTPVLLAAITLDLFAVLLGGATTLLPIFALDILHVGASGLGLLRAAPAVGAVGMALSLAHRSPFKHAGRTLLSAVAGFGAATIVFGFSRWFPLSLAILVVLGALDNISVVTRSTLVLTRTPPGMLGRISAVNGIFIGASNELGGFESGLTAALFGPMLSVVAGGFGTILVVLAVAAIWPEIRRLGRLDERAPRDVPAREYDGSVARADHVGTPPL
ncbi:MAG: MFS transporter [Ktedonobacterales bacterium]|nr:MFS transporter [Ktedonobacterales bacterium]